MMKKALPGIIVAAVAAIALVAGILFWCVARRRKRRQAMNPGNSGRMSISSFTDYQSPTTVPAEFQPSPFEWDRNQQQTHIQPLTHSAVSQSTRPSLVTSHTGSSTGKTDPFARPAPTHSPPLSSAVDPEIDHLAQRIAHYMQGREGNSSGGDWRASGSHAEITSLLSGQYQVGHPPSVPNPAANQTQTQSGHGPPPGYNE
jgi:hypothetical protein